MQNAQPNKKAEFAIGVDVGTKTGIAIWDCNKKYFVEVKTLPIHRALEIVKDYHNRYTVKVRVEDARKRRWFGNSGREQLQGAGSIKRDSVIWADFLEDYKMNYELVAPKNNKTKLGKYEFEKLTKYTGLTSVHSRDGAMLVFGI